MKTNINYLKILTILISFCFITLLTSNCTTCPGDELPSFISADSELTTAETDYSGKFGVSNNQTIVFISPEDSYRVILDDEDLYLKVKFVEDFGEFKLQVLNRDGEEMNSYLFDTGLGELIISLEGLNEGEYIIKLNNNI